MNEILKSLHDRKSVRVFTEEPISDADKTQILEAALAAPSAGCQLLYTILDITDQAKKDRLADLCDHQPFIAKAPMVLIFCADCQKWLSFYQEAGLTPRTPGSGDLLLAVEDAVIAAQNAVTAAQSLNIAATSVISWKMSRRSAPCSRFLPMFIQLPCLSSAIRLPHSLSAKSRSALPSPILSVKMHIRKNPVKRFEGCSMATPE